MQPQTSINEYLTFHLFLCSLLPVLKHFGWHQLFLKNFKVNVSVKPLLKLKQEALGGLILSGLLQQVFKMSNILINGVGPYDTGG